MKKFVSALLVCVMSLCLLASCAGTTPDVAAENAKKTLDDVNWTIAIEGADATEYTMEQAKAHEDTKIHCSMVLYQEPDGNGISYKPVTFLANGIKLKDFLADIGKADATSLTFSGVDQYGKEQTETLDAEQLASDSVILAWIMNKTEPMPNSESFVGILADYTAFDEFPHCCSVSKIIFE